MDNYIIKTLGYKKQARIFFVENTKLINELCDHKKMNRLLKTALGKTIAIASLISGTLKVNQRVSIKINVTNRKHKIFADVDYIGNVRGYINDELLKSPNGSSIEQIIGEKGIIHVLKDLGMNGSFTGITDMPYGNIEDDFSYYFKQSEQIPTIFNSYMIYNERDEFVLSRGIMAQLLPGAPSGLIDVIKKDILESQSIISNTEENNTIDKISNLIFKDIEIIGYDSIQFFCGCSKEILHSMLYSLKREELLDAYENNESIEMACNICGRKYTFGPKEIKRII